MLTPNICIFLVAGFDEQIASVIEHEFAEHKECETITLISINLEGFSNKHRKYVFDVKALKREFINIKFIEISVQPYYTDILRVLKNHIVKDENDCEVDMYFPMLAFYPTVVANAISIHCDRNVGNICYNADVYSSEYTDLSKFLVVPMYDSYKKLEMQIKVKLAADFMKVGDFETAKKIICVGIGQRYKTQIESIIDANDVEALYKLF
jgi:hypothetical protein